MSPSSGRGQTGRRGEELAAEHLLRHGYRIRKRNVRTRLGEIDLVAEHGPTLVFVEVRSRTQSQFGSAAESITGPKQRRLVHLARSYLQDHPHRGPWRIDLVTVEWRDGVPRLEVVPSAVEGG